MNAYATLTLSRDLEGIRYNIKKFSLQAYYYNLKSVYYVNAIGGSNVRMIDFELKNDTYNGLTRSGYKSKYASRIMERVRAYAILNGSEQAKESQRMKRAFENRVEGLSF